MNPLDFTVLNRDLVTKEALVERLALVNSWFLNSNKDSNSTIYNKMYQLLLPKGVKDEELASYKAIALNEEKAALKEMISYLKATLVTRVTVAFQAEEPFLQTLAAKISEASKEKVVLDVSQDPKIVGGLLLEFKGKYHDYSVAPKLVAELHQKLAGKTEEAKDK